MSAPRYLLAYLRINLVITFCWLLPGMPQAFCGEAVTFRTGLASYCMQACQAALLLTPEQTTTLQAAWKSRVQEIQRIRGSGQQLSLDEQREIHAADKNYDQKCNDVLTQSQREFILTVNDITKSVTKTVSADFKPQFDAAFTKEDKKKVADELSKALRDTFVREVEVALPADRLAAFKAVPSEK